MSQLQQAIASGQVLAAQIEAHRAAGELPIVMFEPRLCPANNVICSQGCAQNGACTSNVDAAMTEVFGEIDRGYSPAELPQSLRERCDAEFGDWVNVPVADLRAALDDAERYHAEALAEWAQPLPPTHNKDVILSALRAYQCTEHVDEDGDGSRLVDILTSGSNISAGISEVEALADFLDGALFDAENIAQPVQPATPDLQKAAQAVLDRWNSPKWE